MTLSVDYSATSAVADAARATGRLTDEAQSGITAAARIAMESAGDLGDVLESGLEPFASLWRADLQTLTDQLATAASVIDGFATAIRDTDAKLARAADSH